MQTMHAHVNRVRILHIVRLLMVSSAISLANEMFLLLGYGKLVPVFKPGVLFGSGAAETFFRPVQEPVHLLALSLLRIQHFTNTCDMSLLQSQVLLVLALHWALGQAALMVLPISWASITTWWELIVLILYPLKLAWPLFMTNRLHLHHKFVKVAIGVFLVGILLHVPVTGYIMERSVQQGVSEAGLAAIMHLAGRARHVMTSLLLPMMLFMGDLGLNQLEGEVESASNRNQLQLRFFRWLMHEQRSPLNDISISLSLAQDSVEEFHDITRPRPAPQLKGLDPPQTSTGALDSTACAALAEAALESLETSFDGVKRLQRVMHQVRDFGALVLSETGFAREGEIVFDLRDLNRNIGQQFSAVCKQKKQQLHWSDPCVATAMQSFINSFGDEPSGSPLPQAIPVTADLLRLKSAISTYLANAIKFSKKRANLHVASSITLETSTMRETRLARGGAFGASAVRLLAPKSPTPLAAVAKASWRQLLTDAEASAKRASQHFVSGRNRELYALWTFAVQDEGRGISKEVQAKMWDPFSMLVPHEGVQNRGGGGLSLIIAKSIVEHHGGTLHVSSDGEGKGTCVVMQVSLPIALETVHMPTQTTGAAEENDPEALQWRSSDDTPSQSDGASSANGSTEENSASSGVMGVLSDLSAAITGMSGANAASKAASSGGGPSPHRSRQSSTDVGSDTGSVMQSPDTATGIRFRLASSVASGHSATSDHRDSGKDAAEIQRAMSDRSSAMSRQQSGPAILQNDLSSPGSSLPTPSHALHLCSSDLSVHTEAGVLDQLRELTSPTSAPLSTVSAVPSSMVWSQTMQPAEQLSTNPSGASTVVPLSPMAPVSASASDADRLLMPEETITTSCDPISGGNTPQVTVTTVPLPKSAMRQNQSSARNRARSDEGAALSRPPLPGRPPRHVSHESAGAAASAFEPQSPRRSHTADSDNSGGDDCPPSQLLPRTLAAPLPLRILCVDDAKTTRSLFRRLLKRRTKAEVVDMAENGQVAVDMVREKGVQFYCFITMDKEMPVMDGYEASRAIRAMGFRRTILGVTGNALLSDIQAFTACGVSRVLTKPVDAPVLQAWAEASRWWETHPQEAHSTTGQQHHQSDVSSGMVSCVSTPVSEASSPTPEPREQQA